MCVCENDCDGPRSGSWLQNVRNQVSVWTQTRVRAREGQPRAGQGRRVRARARAEVWALPGMTTSSGPAPGGPWAGRTCRDRGLWSRSHRPAWPLSAHQKNRAGGYAGHRCGAGSSLMSPGGLCWRSGWGKGREAGHRDYPKATMREAEVAGPRIACAEGWLSVARAGSQDPVAPGLDLVET